MSTLAQPAATIELTEKELELREKILGDPRNYPSIMKDWMVDYLSINQPQIPISQVTGFDRLLYTRGTLFPTQPADGQNFTYVVDATNGVMWNFRYNATSASAYKWEFTGGTEAYAEVATDQTRALTTYDDLTTAGPTVTVPLAGDYIVRFGCQMYTAAGLVTVKVGAAAASDTNSIAQAGDAGGSASGARQIRLTGLSASTALKLQYRCQIATTVNFLNRWIFVTPNRVSG